MKECETYISEALEAVFLLEAEVACVSGAVEHDEDLHALHGHQEGYVQGVLANEQLQLYTLLDIILYLHFV